MISAVFSRFSGGFKGWQALAGSEKLGHPAYWFCKEEIVVFGLNSEIFEYRIGPEALHVIPVLYLPMSDGVVYAIAWTRRRG
jgi:hypothetical protein